MLSITESAVMYTTLMGALLAKFELWTRIEQFVGWLVFAIGYSTKYCTISHVSYPRYYASYSWNFKDFKAIFYIDVITIKKFHLELD